MPTTQFTVELQDKRFISANTLQISLRLKDPHEYCALSFVPGQFVQLFFEFNAEQYKRSYSIASSPESLQKTGQLELALGLVENGIASTYFQQAEPGNTLNISAPLGALTLPDALPGQLILVGTGTGISPYRSMLTQLHTLLKQGTAVTLLMGFRYRQEIIYHQDFAHIPHRICLTREASVDRQQNEYAGRVQQQFDALNIDPEKDVVFLCGNPHMIDDCVPLLKEKGLTTRQIKREKYNFSGH